MDTCANEAIPQWGKRRLITSVYLQIHCLNCWPSCSTALFRRKPHIVFEMYLMRLPYTSYDLGWFACFRIQFLSDHIMIHSCLVCVCVNHLKRCKTSMYRCHFALCSCSPIIFACRDFKSNHFISQAGGGSRVQSLPPTKTLWFPWWYMAWSAMRTCFISWLWDVANPKTTMPLSTNWFPVLHGFRNLNRWNRFSFFIGTWAASELTEPQARTKENRHQGYSPRIF